MRSAVGIGVVTLCALGTLALGGPNSTHTGSRKTDNFEVRYRPGSRAGASAPRVAVLAEQELARIAAQLNMKPSGGYELYLYDDVAELHAINLNTQSAGFSAGKASHIPHDNDQTRYHEMVHLVTAELPKTGDAERTLFHVEGIANALLEHVHGVHVHAVAAYYKRSKKLPKLSTMAGGDFYTWLRKHPGFNGYDVAGSYLRHLIDTYGVDAVKKWYTGTRSKQAFGIPPRKLEANWHALLDGYELTPEVETLLAQRDGATARFDVYALDPDKRIPSKLLGRPSHWRSLLDEKLVPLDGSKAAKEAGGLVVDGEDGAKSWRICQLGTRTYGDCAIRVKGELVGPTQGVRVQLGQGAQAMIINGTFVYRDADATAHSATESMGGRQTIDLLIVRRGKQLAVWVDGYRVVEGAVSDEKAPVGVGAIIGKMRFTEIKVRENLPK